MVIRNRLASLLYRALEVAIAIYTLVATFASPLKDIRPIAYFSTEADLFVCIIVVLAFIFNLIDLIRHGTKGIAAYVYMPFTFGSVVYLVGEAVGYWTLYPLVHGVPWADGMALASILSHLVLPLVIFLGWLLFDEKGTIRWKHNLYIFVFPLFYVVYSELAHYIFQDNFFPYEIMKPSFYSGFSSFLSGNGGWNGSFTVMTGVLLAFLLISAGLTLLSNVLAGKYRRNH